MIDKAIILLKEELQSYIKKKDSSDPAVVIRNIGLLETTDGQNLANNIIISLVNIEEESTLKNQSALRRPVGNNAVYQNPPVFLNLNNPFA